MKKFLACFALACCTVAPESSQSQSSSDVLTILRASFTAQAGQTVAQDLTLTGSVEVISGSDDETVPFSFKGDLSGDARTDIGLSSGTLTEIRLAQPGGAAATWSKSNEKTHNIAGHNVMTDPAWCAPLLLLERLIADSSVIVRYVDTNGSLAHFRVVHAPSAGIPARSAALLQHLTQIDLYLDGKTFLPSKIAYNTHPDDDALTDVPVEIDFSAYQTTGGVAVPTHVQKFLNGSLSLDVQIASVVVNSGISATNL